MALEGYLDVERVDRSAKATPLLQNSGNLGLKHALPQNTLGQLGTGAKISEGRLNTHTHTYTRTYATYTDCTVGYPPVHYLQAMNVLVMVIQTA